MLITILMVFGLITLFSAIGLFSVQHFQIKKGSIIVDEDFNGPKQVSVTLVAILRFLLRNSIYFRKFVMQYILHIFVIFMSYLDKITFYFYAKSRNWFVRNAVRNRGTVPHFWNHLKVYKQEMDKEKEENKKV